MAPDPDSDVFNGVSGVVFDFGGVISVSPRTDSWPLYSFCASLGVDRAAVDRGWRLYRSLWDGGEITFEELYRRTFADAGVQLPLSALPELWHLDAEGWIARLSSETLYLMRTLRERGMKIGILSNMSPDFHEKLFVPRAAAYRALAHVETISGLVRCCKPDPAIYGITERELGIPPSRLLFIDDTPANLDAARALGWRALLYSAER